MCNGFLYFQSEFKSAKAAAWVSADCQRTGRNLTFQFLLNCDWKTTFSDLSVTEMSWIPGTFQWQSKTFQYASSEFRRNYVPLWVLFRKWGMKDVCLHKRWGKCYRRCIVKFNFLPFLEWISTFYYVYL